MDGSIPQHTQLIAPPPLWSPCLSSNWGLRVAASHHDRPVFVFGREETPIAAEEEVAPSGPMDVNTAVQMVLKKALAHDGLCRGLHEACRAIELGNQHARLCVLAEDCNQPDYTKLIEALCHEHNVSLISVPTNKQLGEYAGVSLLELRRNLSSELLSSRSALRQDAAATAAAADCAVLCLSDSVTPLLLPYYHSSARSTPRATPARLSAALAPL